MRAGQYSRGEAEQTPKRPALYVWKRCGRIQAALKAARFARTPFGLWPQEYDLIRRAASRFVVFIDTFEKDIFMLAVFYFHFRNALKDLRMLPYNLYASRFAGLLEKLWTGATFQMRGPRQFMKR
jgi:hypothetical protein